MMSPLSARALYFALLVLPGAAIAAEQPWRFDAAVTGTSFQFIPIGSELTIWVTADSHDPIPGGVPGVQERYIASSIRIDFNSAIATGSVGMRDAPITITHHFSGQPPRGSTLGPGRLTDADLMGIGIGTVLPEFNILGYTPYLFELIALDSTGVAFSDTSLPATLDFGSFDRVAGSVALIGSPGPQGFVNFEVTGITQAPEPSAVLLLLPLALSRTRRPRGRR